MENQAANALPRSIGISVSTIVAYIIPHQLMAVVNREWEEDTILKKLFWMHRVIQIYIQAIVGKMVS